MKNFICMCRPEKCKSVVAQPKVVTQLPVPKSVTKAETLPKTKVSCLFIH